MDPIAAYIPQDRRQALARGTSLPERATGAALFVDISGFTSLTEHITQVLGPRRGAEELTRHLNAVYDALIAEVERYTGSVLSFAGDAITCWFDDSQGTAAPRAVACAIAMQSAMHQFAAISLPDGTAGGVAHKAAVASGPVRRFLVGDPDIQLIDTLAGATVARTAAAEGLAHRGEILVDVATAAALGPSLKFAEWRTDPVTHESFAVVESMLIPAQPQPWPALPQALGADLSRAWLFPAVYERERSGQGPFLTEFRPVVPLFLHFAGLDYERDDAGPHLDHFIRRSQSVLARYEGTLLAVIIGDKGSYFYAAFGAPVAHEDDARRAVKAALELRRLPDEINTLAPLQIGISRGTMRVGAYGGSTRRTYGVLGDDVNVAARLMGQATPGEALISWRVQQALGEEFSLEPRPPLHIKGKAEPLAVFAVTGTQERRASRLQEPSYTLPMMGRRRELALIEEKITLALQGQGQIVALTAEAGMGKSRLVAEVIRLARRRNLIGYGGACQSDGRNTSYLVWWPIWRAFFDVDPALSFRKQVRLLESELDDRAPARAKVLPLLSAALGVSLPDNGFTLGLEPKDRKTALHALLVDCLHSAAREATQDGGGLLLVLEDLHWIDPASYDLLEEVAHVCAPWPVLIVLSYRPVPFEHLPCSIANLESMAHFTRIALTELSTAETEQAIRAKLMQLFPERSGSVPPMLVERVVARAQGNPFYMEELLNYLRDRGIDPSNEAALDSIDLPASLHSLILSRIDQLSARQQLGIKVASVIGRVFRLSHLCGYYPALGEPHALRVDLDILAGLGLTPLATSESEPAYLFRHIVTRDVAYESLAYATRAALHEQYARFIEDRLLASQATGEDAPEASLIDLLAYHYELSENVPKKREYLQRAGVAAAARYANVEAAEYLTRGLAITPVTDLAGRYALLLARENVYGLTGMRGAQAQDLAELEALAAQLNDPAQHATLALDYAAYADMTGDYPAAAAHAQRAVSFARAAGNVKSEARGHLSWGNVLLHQADYAAAAAQFETALALARSAGLSNLEAEALRNLGIIAERKSEYAGARTLLERSLELYRQAGDWRGESKSLNSLGVVAYAQSDYVAARLFLEQSLRLKHDIGDRHGEGVALSNLGIIADMQDDFGAAQAYFEQCLRLCREIGDREGVSAALAGLGNAALNLGDPIAARDQFEQAWRLADEIGDREGVGSALTGLGSVALHLGDYSAAQAYFEQSLHISDEISDRRNEGSVLAKLGLLAHYVGNNAAAGDLSRQALAIAQEVGDLSHQGDAFTGLGHVLMAQGHLEEAVQAYRRVLALRRELGQTHQVIDALAHLAHATLRGGHTAQAHLYAEDILNQLETKPPRGQSTPFVYLIVYQALSASGDVRAHDILEQAYAILQERAAKIPDEAFRRAFLENVHWHRELAAAWQQRSTS